MRTDFLPFSPPAIGQEEIAEVDAIEKDIFVLYKSIFKDRESTFFFWKGRVALYSILRCLGLQPGDEVIVPGFTCVVVANAIIYLGAKPIYADIDPLSYNINVETVEPLISSRTKVIIAQNTFGLSPDLDSLLSLAEERGICLIEDCAHGLGGSYKNRPAGTVAHASFFSTQWSKPLTTGLGGVAYIRDKSLAGKMAEFYKTLPEPNAFDKAMLALQLLLFPLVNYPNIYYALVNLYRFLTQKAGLSVGSSSGDELLRPAMPTNYLKRMGTLQFRLFFKNLKRLKNKVIKRNHVWNFYNAYFCNTNIQTPYPTEPAGHSMLRYPIRVRNKSKVLSLAMRHKIPIGDWFVSPLHPIEGNLEPWGYRYGMCPHAEKACEEVINLFTDHALSSRKLNILYKIIVDGMDGW